MRFTRIKTCTDYRSHDSHHLVTGISPGKLPTGLSRVVVKELLLQKTLHGGFSLPFNLKYSKLPECKGNYNISTHQNLSQ
jgi:hypothetical protein